MSKSAVVSRHRADTRTKTPLTMLSEAVSSNAGVVGRRAAIVAGASGLIVTMGLPAQATELQGSAKDAKTAEASTPEAPVNNKALSVSADAKVSFAQDAFKAKAAPKPVVKTAEDTVEKAGSQNTDSSSDSRSTTNVSRSAERTEAGSSAPSNVKGGSIVSIAMRYIGVPYVSGGKGPSGWDCSGFTSYVYKQAGISIPSSSSAQRASGTVVSASEARPGDIIWHPGHVGIYAGNGMMIDAGNPRVGTSHRSYSWMGSVTFLRFG